MTDEVRREETERRDLGELVESPSQSLLAEFWLFLRENKKWWLLPLLLALLVLGLLVVLSGTGLAPFIYPFV